MESGESYMNVFKKSVLAVGIGAAMSAFVAPNAQAVGFNWGEIEGSFNSTFSYGSSWRVEKRDLANQVGIVNNPNNGLDWSGYSAFGNTKYISSELFAKEGSYSSNGDLGNLAWSKGDAFSQVVKGLHELDLRYENYGIFIRGMYFHDFALDGELDYRRELNHDNATDGIDLCVDKKADEDFCSDIRLLDAYFTADWEFGETPISFRIGQQVISWGESALISHGISTTNAVDLGRLRTPGAELKEAFIPQGMAWISAGLTENLSMEAYYQYEWQGTVVPAAGTYFSSNDFVAGGGRQSTIQLGFNGNPDIHGDFLIAELDSLAKKVKSGQVPAETLASLMLAYPTKVAIRSYDKKPEDGGQYGLKFAYQFEDTEVAFYHMNYHSRRPLISGQASDFTATAIAHDLAELGAAAGNVNYDTLEKLDTFTKAKIVFPEDIKLYGVSFNTTLGETSFAGEVSHRQDEALQIDDVELLFAAMPQQLANANLRPDLEGISQLKGVSYPFAPNDKINPGDVANGFVTVDTTQAQFNLAHLFGPTWGADNLTLFGEFGAVWIHDMPDPDVLRLNGPNTARSGGNPGKEAVIKLVHNGPETNPFPTDFAWGYRLVAKTDHNNIFDGVNASVKVVFSHDVKGITPDPIFLFTQGAKSVGASIDFDYQNRWSASFGYNSFWGGKGTINTMEDKDFVSFSIKYSI